MVTVRLTLPVEELTRRSREAARRRRDAENAAWTAALNALREVLDEHSAEHGTRKPLPIGVLLDEAARRSKASGTVAMLAFDWLEHLGEAQYRLGQGVFTLRTPGAD